MSEPTIDQPIKSRVLSTKPVHWKKFQYIQQEDFKQWSPEAKSKLRASVLNNNFTQPFYVWQDPSDSVIYCLDGRHRTLILEELETEGRDIPALLPATFIDCKDKQEAAKLVLVYSSMYARVTDKGLFDFMELYDLNREEMISQIDLPDFSFKQFNGDLDTDFSLRNKEIYIEEFTDEIILKFKYPKPEYFEIKKRINQLQEEHQLDSPEAVIKFLLNI